MKKNIAFALMLIIICLFLTACETDVQIGEEPNHAPVESSTFNEEYTIASDRFYFNQLSKDEKKVYNELLTSSDGFVSHPGVVFSNQHDAGTIWPEQKNNNLTRALFAYWFDNPMSSLFYNGDAIIKSRMLANDQINFCLYFDLKIEPNHSFGNPEELANAVIQVEETVKRFVNTLEGSKTEKIKAIHDWIIADAVYEETPHCRNIYGAIIEKKGICYGFAHAFKYVCDIAGLEAVSVGNEDHVWNYVRLEDGRWYLVDTTWDLYGGSDYLLVEIEPEFTSGKRYYETTWEFLYTPFHK